MSRRRLFPLFGLLLAVALVVSGALSARQMGPDRETMMAEAALLSMGATLADLCEGGGDAGHAHGHDCPFCHKLPEAQAAGFAVAETRVVHDSFVIRARDLVHGPQTFGADRTARAPPHFA